MITSALNSAANRPFSSRSSTILALLSATLLAFVSTAIVSCGSEDSATNEPTGSTGGKVQIAELPAVQDEYTPLRKEGDPALAPEMAVSASGIKHKVVLEGTGESPVAGSVVKLHHTAWILREGKLYKQLVALDSRASHEADALLLAEKSPVSSTVGTSHPLAPSSPRPVFLKGWVESIASMKKGERRWMIVPSDLAYGSTGFGDLIPPDTDLVFDIQLVDFTPPRIR